MQARDGFNSKLGALLAIAGSAIGLGNLWKFPYMVGENGGSVFIIMYLLCVLLICVPVMLTELALGRKTQTNMTGALKLLAPGTRWYLVGLLAVFTTFVILSFYSVVAGWTMEYIYLSATDAFAGKSASELSGMFTDFTSSTYRPLAWHALFMLITSLVVALGVKSGIEKVSKLLMPLLFLLVVMLAIRTLTLSGSSLGLAFLFEPDWSKLSPKVMLNALGQAFFSLSLGMGILFTYGSYMNRRESLVPIGLRGALADTLFALLAAVAIIPAVFVFGLEPSQGPGLAFIALPNVFQQMPGGFFFATIFFTIFLVAALTSSISILEVQVSFYQEQLRLSRGKAVLLGASSAFVVGVLCSLSFGSLKGATVGGLTVFDILDTLTTKILLPMGSLGLVLFAGWRTQRRTLYREFAQGERRSVRLLSQVIFFVIRYVAPAAIVVVFVAGLLGGMD